MSTTGRPQTAIDNPQPAIGRVVVTTDFSLYSAAALDWAAVIAGRFGARLSLLHVVEPVLLFPGLAAPPGESFEETVRGRREALEAAAAEVRGRGVAGLREVDTCVRTGVPYEQICQMAREEPVDLIVIGAHGRSGWSEILIGSVAERVVRLAPCPVLAVKQPSA